MRIQVPSILIDDLRDNLRIMYPGGQIHVAWAPMDESLTWSENIKIAAPHTQLEYSIWKVGHQYGPFKKNQETCPILLVNFNSYTCTDEVLNWAKRQYLIDAIPLECFAVATHCPHLNKDLLMDFMSLVSLEPCVFENNSQVCSIFFDGLRRKAHLNLLQSVWSSVFWFAFKKGERKIIF